MKIKAVCEVTKLTDRTIRFYIEEGLVSPKFTENYMGRRTFDFTEEDVKDIQDIAILRKYGFSITEIREMKKTPEKIFEITKELELRKQESVNEETELLEKLSQATNGDEYTFSELAEFLSKPVENKPTPKDEESFKRRALNKIRNCVRIVVVYLPIFLFVIGANFAFTKVKYPVIQWGNVILAILMIALSLVTRSASKKATKKTVKRLYYFLCAFCSLFTFIFSYFMTSSASVTTSFNNYGVFYEDEYHLPIDSEYADFFRAAPMEIYEQKENGYYYLKPDAKYYYCYDNNWNNIHGDIYGEWTVSKETMQNEIIRVKDLFSQQSDIEEDEQTYEMKKGDWNCIIKNDPTMYPSDYNDKAFEIDGDGYFRYYIFAYNEKDLRIRYISAYGEEYRGEMPYYMSLDW